MKYFRVIIVLALCFSIGIFAAIYIKNKKTDNDIISPLSNIAVTIKRTFTNQPTITKVNHVFVIIEENHSWSTILKNHDAPYINNELLKKGAYASNYHNISPTLGELHPSELNYISIEAGTVKFSDYTFTTDNGASTQNSTASTQHLVTLLEKNGYSWKAYEEGISGNECPIQSSGDYAAKHDPFVFFHDVSGNPPSTDNKYCQQHIRPLSELAEDIETGNLPNYVFITPNLQHDMHNGTIAQADTWLAQQVPTIMNSPQFKKDGALFITWDEGSEKQDDNKERNDPIGMIILSPFAKKNYTDTTMYSHASLLKTIEEIFQIKPLLGLANDPQTKDLRDFFTP